MSRLPDKLVIASRGSRLSLHQSELIAGLVRAAHPAIDIEVRTVKTTGDRDQRPFSQIGGKGLFTTEVEREVMEGRADVAVHSAKDLTAELGPGCAIVCIPQRAAAHDVLVGGHGDDAESRLGSLPAGARVGTSSMRRRALVLEVRSDLEPVELRGNLDTRVRKVADGEVDAAILAAAGLERLALEVSAVPLDPQRWIPAPAQGALAVEALAQRDDLVTLFEPLSDAGARAEVTCERAFAAHLEGGCSVPLGCLARSEGSELAVWGFLGRPDGSQGLRDRISGGVHEAESLGRELAEAILLGGGDDILEEIKETQAPEVVEP